MPGVNRAENVLHCQLGRPLKGSHRSGQDDAVCAAPPVWLRTAAPSPVEPVTNFQTSAAISVPKCCSLQERCLSLGTVHKNLLADCHGMYEVMNGVRARKALQLLHILALSSRAVRFNKQGLPTLCTQHTSSNSLGCLAKSSRQP